MKKAILVVLVFIIMQVVVPIVATYLFGAYDMSFGKTGKVAEQISNPYVLSGMMLVSYVLIVAALYGWRLLSPSAGLVRRNRLLPLAVVIMVLAIVPMSYVEELLDLNDATGGSVKMLMYNPLGVFCITIIGPVVEELVFRRAFLGSLLEKNIKPVIAVPVSALVFGLVHFNPAQIPAAFVLGTLLGWMYLRTGSLVPSIVCHVVNNALCVALALCFPDDIGLSGLLGGTSAAVWMSFGCAIAAVYLIGIYNKKTAVLQEPVHEIKNDEN